ncbi:MAG: hypothetical protein LBF28_03065 [Rickettsiales bacterium]|nr:hypothetical protein [Rickettsiales bacterium]
MVGGTIFTTEVEIREIFKIMAYIGSEGGDYVTSTNPYSGSGKANSNPSSAGSSDGDFGGAGGTGHDSGVGKGSGGGNALGNAANVIAGSYDTNGGAGSTCRFLRINDAFLVSNPLKSFQIGGCGGRSYRTYILGGGGGANGGGAGGSGYETDPYVGGSGTGGGGGARYANGQGIGAGKANGRGGAAYFDGENWHDVFDQTTQGASGSSGLLKIEFLSPLTD